jgi:hypothetical protein
MKRNRLSYILLTAFVLALALYATAYWLIESRRTRHTPWEVNYLVNASGQATLAIRQQSLGLGPVRIRFASASPMAPGTETNLVFSEPRPVPYDLPFGRCVFADLTFLPGTVVLNLNGTDIQMLPRALTIATNEFAWSTTHVVEIRPDGTPHRIE